MAVESLICYQKKAMKSATCKHIDAGWCAQINQFKGLIVFSQTKEGAIKELKSALWGWIDLALSRADGLPSLP